jgi:hypothetical protein
MLTAFGGAPGRESGRCSRAGWVDRSGLVIVTEMFHMLDVVFVVVTVAAFALLGAAARGVERL